MRTNIISVFGKKFADTLTPISLKIKSSESDIKDTNNNNCFSENMDDSVNIHSKSCKSKGKDIDSSQDDDSNRPIASTPKKVHLLSATPEDVDCSILSMEDTVQNTNRNSENSINPIISGFVSKSGTGIGRSDKDHQFVFVNGRPVVMQKVIKVVKRYFANDIFFYSYTHI